MVWTQALLWLIMGMIIGGFVHHWLAGVGERHMRVVSIGICNDAQAPHLHIKATVVLEKLPLHEKDTVGTVTIADPNPPRGFNEINWAFPLTTALRDDFSTLFLIRQPGRHPGREYVAPFVVEHEGHRFVDVEMSRGGYTLHTYADAKGIDEFIDELRAAKEELLLTSPTAEVEALVEGKG